MSALRRISTIIATCNRAALLLQALDSLARQQLPPFEVVIVDDGSGPDTRRALSRWQESRPGKPFALRYFYQCNSGPAVARNRGAAEACGELLQFLDDDDLLAPEALQRLHAALPADGAAAVAMASHRWLYQSGDGPVRAGPVVAPVAGPPRQRLSAMIAGSWFVPVHGYLFTRAALARMGPWDPSLASQEDDELLLRAALRGVDFLPAPGALVHYRQHEGARRATPGTSGETLGQGQRQRLADDLAIRENVATELRRMGALDGYRPAFEAWRRRLLQRYGHLLRDGGAVPGLLWSWLGEGGRSTGERWRRRASGE